MLESARVWEWGPVAHCADDDNEDGANHAGELVSAG